MVTHENDIAAWARRVIRLRDGRVESRRPQRHPRRAGRPGSPIVQRSTSRHRRPTSIDTIVPRGLMLLMLVRLASRARGLCRSRNWASSAAAVAGRPQPVAAQAARRSCRCSASSSAPARSSSLMAFGEGSMQDALEDIKRQGATNIIVRSVKPPDDSATASRSFVATYGLTYGTTSGSSTLGDADQPHGPDAGLPDGGPRTWSGCTTAGSSAPRPSTPTSTSSSWPRGRFLIERGRARLHERLRPRGGGGRQAVPVRGPARPDGQ